MPAGPASFCQIEIGDIEVTFVPDGYIYSSAAIRSFPGSSDELWQSNSHLLDSDGLVVMSLGTLLVRTAGKLVLVDLGWGPGAKALGDGSPGSDAGRIGGGAMLDNLFRLGVRPEDVDAVVFSHLHSDHTGWIVDPTASSRIDDQSKAMFPNADHYLSGAEWEYWSALSAEGEGPAPSSEQLSVLSTRLELVIDGQTPVPGIEVMATPGHTPGHLSFVISSGNQRAVVLGDAVHCPIEILQPELSFIADVDPEMAQRTRIHIEQELSRPDTITAAPHFADLVFGRLIQTDGRSSWSFPGSQVLAVAG